MNDIVDTTLLCPNQLRSNGLIVDDVPLHLSPANQPSTHSIYLPEEDLRPPLSLIGVISVLNTCTSTQEELDSCKWVTLTNDACWDPHSSAFQENERIPTLTPLRNERLIYGTNTQDHMHSKLAMISAALDCTPANISALTTTSSRNPRVTPELLSQRWGIGLEMAKKMLRVTTQKRIQQVSGPLEQRLWTWQAHLGYKQFRGRHGRFYTDTFFASIPSTSGKKMAQIFTNDIHFMKTYPMSWTHPMHYCHSYTMWGYRHPFIQTMPKR
jgi:hypothetical protein